MNLTEIAFVALAAIAAGGLLLLATIVSGIKTSRFMGRAHGLGGFVALVVLLVANLQDKGVDRAWWAFAVVLLGFVGGVVLLRISSRGAMPPLRLVAAHGALAAIGLYLLYGAAF